MALNTPNSSLPYPELTDIPNALTAFQNLALALDTKVVPKFATSVARDSAIPSPVEGQLCYRTDINGLQEYNGSWRPANVINCTSGTRPSSPETGRLIFETDTNTLRRYSGSAWVLVGPYNFLTSLGSAAANVDLTIPSTLRLVKITYGARCVGAVVIDNLVWRFNNTSGGHVYNRNSNGTQFSNDQGNNHFPVGLIPGASAGSANDWGDGELTIHGWSQPSSARPMVRWHSGVYTSTSIFLEHGQGMVTNSGPFTTIRVFANGGSNLATGTWFRVEGWE